MDSETLNPNNAYGVYVSMLMLFRSSDIITLLGSFNYHISGSKAELQSIAIDLLKNTPRSFCHTYSLRIIDMFKSLYCVMDNGMTPNETQYQNQQQTLSVVHAQYLMPVNMHDQQQLQLQQQQHLEHQLLPQYQLQQQHQLLQQQQQYQMQQQHQLQQQIMIRKNMQGQQQMSGSLLHDQQHMASSQQVLIQEPMYGFNMEGNNNFQSVDSYNTDHHNQFTYDRHENLVSHNQQLNALTPSNHTVTTNDNVQHPATNFTFKKNPFYNITDEIMKPTILTVQDACLFLKTIVSSNLKSNMFKIKLSFEQSAMISMNTKLLNGNVEYPCQLQMRIGRLQANSTEIHDSLPTRFFIQSNEKINESPERVLPRSNPIDCTRLFKLDINAVNEVAIHWDQDGNTYVVAIYLVHRLSSNSLLNKLFYKKSKSVEDTINLIISKIAEFDPDVQTTTSYHFSLICPLSKIRMKTPVNSINCNHLQCFDAGTFILMNEKKPTWKCPTCNIPCLYDDLQVHFYFMNILSNSYVDESVEEIELLHDGTWRELDARKLVNNVETVSETNHIPCVNNRPFNNVIDVIDLTE